MRLKALLILGPILALAGLGMNATLGQPGGDDPPPKKGPKGDRKGKDDRKGGPKEDGDGPPPHDQRGGPDLMRLIDDLDLSPAQQEKVRRVMQIHHEKMRIIMEKAQRSLLADLKKTMPAAQYRKLEREIQNMPKGPPKKGRKGKDGDEDSKGPKKGPKEDGEDEDGKRPKKGRKGPPKEDRDEEVRSERIGAPRIER